MADAWELSRDAFLSTTEADALLGHLEARALRCGGRARDTAELDRLIIEALLLSGLRNSEFCGLTVGDTAVGTGVSAFMVRRRGHSRTVYVPGHVTALVRRFVADTRPRFLPENVDPGDLAQPLVFSEHRRPYERTGLYRRVVKVLTEAGLGERASVQLLRHTYGYVAYVRTGGNLLFVQRQLGHAHPRITSVYAQFVEESYAELAERVAAGRVGVPPAGPAAELSVQAGAAFDCETD